CIGGRSGRTAYVVRIDVEPRIRISHGSTSQKGDMSICIDHSGAEYDKAKRPQLCVAVFSVFVGHDTPRIAY
ncbi:hypothetical protein P9E08_20765, partial [Bacillus mojavensis]|uniref:hypothetical protein n=1 Tax=Bacillus mojavensis TaxID=72360 RepID=UPI002DB860A0